MTNASPLLTFDEAATYLRMHRTTLSKHVSAGNVFYVTNGEDPDAPGACKYFLPEDLDSFIRNRRRKAQRLQTVRLQQRRVAAGGEPW